MRSLVAAPRARSENFSSAARAAAPCAIARENDVIAKLVIGMLVAVVLVLLYRGMEKAETAVDPLAPLDAKKILAVLHNRGLACDTVDSYTPLGQSTDGWDCYIARCRNGGRFVYFQKPATGQVGATSCKDQAFYNSYRCPD
jgi:hypothetical protein